MDSEVKAGLAEKKKREETSASRKAIAAAGGNDKAARDADKGASAVLAKEAKSTAAVASVITDMEDKVRLQKMLNDGKEREVAIEEALISARKKAGRDLSPGEAAKVAGGAGSLFDLSAKPGEAANAAGVSGRGSSEFSDSLRRIGGTIGATGGSAGITLDKERNKLLVKSAASLATIASSVKDGTLP
jgi:hypothetical protein